MVGDMTPEIMVSSFWMSARAAMGRPQFATCTTGRKTMGGNVS
jgi:hypothetical protein